MKRVLLALLLFTACTKKEAPSTPPRAEACAQRWRDVDAHVARMAESTRDMGVLRDRCHAARVSLAAADAALARADLVDRQGWESKRLAALVGVGLSCAELQRNLEAFGYHEEHAQMARALAEECEAHARDGGLR